MKRTNSIPGYTLLYALVALVLVTTFALLILTYSSINSSHYFKMLRYNKGKSYGYQSLNKLCDSTLPYNKNILLQLDDGYNISFEKLIWGFYDIYCSSVYTSDNDTLFSKVGLIGGQKDESNATALFLNGSESTLRVGNNTHIQGAIFCPLGIVKPYLTLNYSYDTALIYNSDEVVQPKVSIEVEKRIKWIEESINNATQLNFSMVNTDVLQSFKHDTKVFKSDSLYINEDIKGNVILKADYIYVDRSSNIENAIIIGNIIIIDTGFVGSCQIYASDSLIINKESKFQYPSIISLLSKQKIDKDQFLFIGDSVSIYGDIYIYTSAIYEGNMRSSLGEGLLVKGGIYSNMSINFKGRCFGRIYTKALVGNMIKQDNLLNDVFISIDSLPYYYSFSLPYPGRVKYKIVKWLF